MLCRVEGLERSGNAVPGGDVRCGLYNRAVPRPFRPRDGSDVTCEIELPSKSSDGWAVWSPSLGLAHLAGYNHTNYYLYYRLYT